MFTGNPGIVQGAITGNSPIDFFNVFFTENVKDLIYRETTLYAEQDIRDTEAHLQEHKHARENQWKHNPMNREEVNVLLSVLIVMGVVGFPTQRYIYMYNLLTLCVPRSYWSTKWPFNCDIFKGIITGRRFELLMRYLHLNDKDKMPPTGSPSHDKIYKIRPLLECITQAFRSVYTPRQNLSIDETIISFKGRLSWIQYMPKKPHKWGIKAWALADSSNGYISNFKLYTGL